MRGRGHALPLARRAVWAEWEGAGGRKGERGHGVEGEHRSYVARIDMRVALLDSGGGGGDRGTVGAFKGGVKAGGRVRPTAHL